MDALLNGRETDLRAAARANVFLAATLVARGSSFPVRVRNMSRVGVLVDGNGLPKTGTAVRLRRGSLTADGEVAWDNTNQRGIRFLAQIDLPAWTKPIGHAGQAAVDRALQAIQPGRVLDSHALQEAAIEGLQDTFSLGQELAAICERLADSGRLDTVVGEELLKLENIAHRLSNFQACRGLI